jgi:hypothetical protein
MIPEKENPPTKPWAGLGMVGGLAGCELRTVQTLVRTLTLKKPRSRPRIGFWRKDPFCLGPLAEPSPLSRR